MQNFFLRLKSQLFRFLSGRYGVDALFLPVVILSCAATFLSNFKGLGVLRLLGMALLVYALFRVLSKNYEKRRKELAFYCAFSQKVQNNFRLRKKMYDERHTKKYFKCPHCRTWLSVPKGKGKLKIRCIRCNHEFFRKS